ncbi:signal peptidase II [Anaeromyxobacter paludicola]|uniref:Lipoprotein signal peptidase n=1 Tax=Anaeromyxobacter paludicola TaxID=2918171 RepID=A0ABN6NCP3_9BACT|nr:signal peptidase II [Anaeromyxobacter paludicola]BDG09733.1 lipoprotein signal peptidase [Anaeromyxobacter paludicola]
MRLAPKWRLLLALFLALVTADQVTKFLAVDRLTTAFDRAGAHGLGEKVAAFYALEHLEPYATAPFYVWSPVWRMNYVENPGAAWGLFRGLSDGVRNAFFTVVSLGAVAFILHYYRRLREEQRYLQLAMSLVLAGAVGNFIDRIARRYVIDFVEWYWWNRPDIRWPTFNVADSLIVVGVALLMLQPSRPADRPDPV